MINLSRRDFVVSTGLAAALGLNSRLIVPAFAQKTADPAKPFVTYKVGSAEVTAIYDGIWEKPHDPAFISNASVDDVKAAMVKAGSSDPAKYLPVLAATTEYKGVTGPITFDEKGDIKNGALTLFTYKMGKREQLAVIR